MKLIRFAALGTAAVAMLVVTALQAAEPALMQIEALPRTESGTAAGSGTMTREQQKDLERARQRLEKRLNRQQDYYGNDDGGQRGSYGNNHGGGQQRSLGNFGGGTSSGRGYGTGYESRMNSGQGRSSGKSGGGGGRR